MLWYSSLSAHHLPVLQVLSWSPKSSWGICPLTPKLRSQEDSPQCLVYLYLKMFQLVANIKKSGCFIYKSYCLFFLKKIQWSWVPPI